MQNSGTKIKVLFLLSLAIFLIVLYFGLREKGYHFSNNVAWIGYEPGIRFGKYGVAYASVDNNLDRTKTSPVDSFSTEMAVKPEDLDPKGFGLILSLYGEKDSDQLIVGQWQSSIVVMNGDDYSHKRKTKRISADIFSRAPKKLLLTVTTGVEGTKLYVNGKLVEAKSDLFLKIPEGDAIRVIVGNSVHGTASWKGEMYGLALYGESLEPETIRHRFGVWSQGQIFTSAKDGRPFLSFAFNEREGTETIDSVTRVVRLKIPTGFHILKKRLLSPPWRDFDASKSFLMDFVINLLGFIPLGFVLYALFTEAGGIVRKEAILFSIAFCFLTSLFIEIAQAWMPSRSSQSLDLILNTVGSWVGTMLYGPILRMKKRRAKGPTI